MFPSVPQPGDVVADKYEIARQLGKGGMGVVFEALHRKLGTRVAIKFLMPDALVSHDGVARFDREARASALLRSPYVVRVLDIDATSEGLPFIVMEYLEGRDLGSELRRRGTIPVPEAVDWVLQACIGLSEAHARGIIHRDIKPANLYLCTEAVGPIVKVMDFGVSKLAGMGEVDLTTTETTVGTPSYMAPEQLLSSKLVDHRVDVWALGVVLFRMLSGGLPFVAPSPTALAIAIATQPPIDLESVAPGLPRGLVDAVMRALEKDPGQRHADAVKLGLALEPYGSGAVAFGAAVARTPPPHALDSSRQLAPDADDSTERMNATAQPAVATTPASTSRALLVGLAIAALAMITLFVFGYRSFAAARARASAATTSLDGGVGVGSVGAANGGAGALDAPPPMPVLEEPPPAARSAEVHGASSSAASAPRGPRPAPRPSGSPSRPSRPASSGAAPDDPLHL